MTLILVYTLSKTILGHSFFNYILVVSYCIKWYIKDCSIKLSEWIFDLPFSTAVNDITNWNCYLMATHSSHEYH